MSDVTLTLTRDELYEIQIALTERRDRVFKESIETKNDVIFDITRRQFDRCSMALHTLQQYSN